MKRRGMVTIVSALVLFMGLSGCQTQHKVETLHRVEVAPMHISIDVNVKVDRALDDYFSDIDNAGN